MNGVCANAGSQVASASAKDAIIIKTVVPVGSVFLVAAFVAIAAFTGCFGAKAAAAKAAGKGAAATGKYASKSGAYASGGPIPLSVTASAGR